MDQGVNEIGLRGRPLLVQLAADHRQVNVIAALQAAGLQGYVTRADWPGLRNCAPLALAEDGVRGVV